ncbi:YafY family protein [Saccharothrix sp.]|uniref:helix-turn-helix transcriptional regulator n=1 Tax=Saccharothrix sp. TaxID=1873460 RepID=UPI0028119E7D|nr:YafY family protein [Saccharothrix sp.]
MLRLLSLLQARRHWPGAELAERLSVSERTLRRDVDRLRDLGYPVEARRGVAGGYGLRSGAAMPPLLLDDEEAVAIAVGLRAAAGGAVAGIEETSVRALAKIVAVMPPRLRRRADALRAYTVPALAGGRPVDVEALLVLAQACRDGERVRFDYAARDGTRTTRLAEPHRLVGHGRRWYLVAWDTERHGWRTFRLDRLADPRATGARFRQRELPGGDAAAFVRDSFAAVPTRHRVVVTVHAPAGDVERIVVHTGGTVEPVDERTCRLLMSVDDFDWPAFVLGALSADFDVVHPPELRDHLRAVGERFLAS